MKLVTCDANLPFNNLRLWTFETSNFATCSWTADVVLPIQCDQIWRNFDCFGKILSLCSSPSTKVLHALSVCFKVAVIFSNPQLSSREASTLPLCDTLVLRILVFRIIWSSQHHETALFMKTVYNRSVSWWCLHRSFFQVKPKVLRWAFYGFGQKVTKVIIISALGSSPWECVARSKNMIR